MTWKGLALKSELAMIIRRRILSSSPACGISTILEFGVEGIQCILPLGSGKRCAFSFPDQPSFGSSQEVWRGRLSSAQQGYFQPEFSRRTPS